MRDDLVNYARSLFQRGLSSGGPAILASSCLTVAFWSLRPIPAWVNWIAKH
ncbi:conserved domain protein [Yersinia pestis KIM D27]|nr:conserved domain protein [Yersinia pestis KIM D27]